jgi:tetratricopeptide (TPR) repeat protein
MNVIRRKKSVFYSFLLLIAMFTCSNSSVTAEKKLTEMQWFEQGNQFFNSKDYDKAVKAYSETIKLNPQNVDAYNRRGLIYKMKNQYENAIADFTKVIEYVQNNENVYYNRGDTYFINKQYELAIADFSKAIQINPKFSKVFVRRGLSYYEIVTQAYFKAAEKNVPLTDIMSETQRFSYFDLIITDLSKAIELKPDFTYAYTVRGNVYSDKGQYDLAIADFDTAIKLDERYAAAHYFKGLTLEGLKNKKEAIESYNKFLQYADPNDLRIDMVKKSLKALKQDIE